MRRYLDKIRAGTPVNYEVFLRRLPPAYRQCHRSIFAVERVAPERWQVRILDEARFRELEVLAAPVHSRSEAAARGDSHRSRTRHCCLLVYHEAVTGRRPDTILLSEQGADYGFRPKSRALVIENEDNFFAFPAMLAFAARELGTESGLHHCDVILGAGKRITRSLCLDWLERYERIDCAFDYDPGGLQIFATIRSRLGNRAHYLQPRDWQQWRHCFQKTPKTRKRFLRAIRLAEDLGFGALAGIFRETGRFMEQEIILDERPTGES